MQKLALAILGAAALIALAGCGNHSKSGPATPPSAPVAVRVESVGPATTTTGYEAVGTVHSRTVSVLSSKVIGQVLVVAVREGDRVKSGQRLVEIDSRDGQASLAKARAGHVEAEGALQEVDQAIGAADSTRTAAHAASALAASTHRRYQALLERKSVSLQEFEEIEFKHRAAEAEARRADEMLASLQAKRRQVLARIDQAHADLSSAETNLSHFTIAAPFDGIVISKRAEVGSLATPGAPLLTLEDSQAYRFEAAVDESQLTRIRVGDRATVSVDAAGGATWETTVAEIVPAADPASRSFVVKLNLPPAPTLHSGMFGRVRFASGQKELLTVPMSALVEQGQLTGVFVVDAGNAVRFRLVKTGKRFDSRVEILAGLDVGEHVVVDQTTRLSDGIQVTLTGTGS